MTTEATELVLDTLKVKLENAERQLAAAMADCWMLRNALESVTLWFIHMRRGDHDESRIQQTP